MSEQLPPTIWRTKSRIDYQTKSRNYALWSFFSTVLTAITDPKDWMGIRIKTDPAYFEDPLWRGRTRETERMRRSRIERE